MSKLLASSSINAAYAAAQGVLYSGARADAVTAALVVIATDYASNGGSKPRIEKLAADCKVTASGAPRKMTPNASHTLLLEWVEWVLQSAPLAGARPQNGSIELRDAALSAYAVEASTRWEALRDFGEQERTAARNKAAKAKVRADKAGSSSDTSVSEEGTDTAKTLAPVAKVDAVAVALAALSPEELADLVKGHASAVARLVNIAEAMRATSEAIEAGKAGKSSKAPAPAVQPVKEATA